MIQPLTCLSHSLLEFLATVKGRGGEESRRMRGRNAGRRKMEGGRERSRQGGGCVN